MSGDTTAYRLCTFIKRPSSKSTFFKPRFTLVPYNAETITSPTEGVPLKHEVYEDVVHELVTIGSVPTSGVFPFGLAPRGSSRRDTIHTALTSTTTTPDKHTVIVGCAYTSTGYAQGSFDYDGGANAGGSCETFMITRREMIEIVGGVDVLVDALTELPGMPDVDERQLQQTYLASKGWTGT
jgi:hypothetical protein